MNVFEEERALESARWQSFVERTTRVSSSSADPTERRKAKGPPHTSDEPSPELAESWFGREGRPRGSDAPPSKPWAVSFEPPPESLGDPLADEWFK